MDAPGRKPRAKGADSMDLKKSTRAEMDALSRFVATLVLKDEAAAEAAETADSSRAGYDLIAAVFKTDTLDDNQRHSLIANYIDGNPYYRALQLIGVDAFKARTSQDMAILKYNSLVMTKERNLHFEDQYAKCLTYYSSVLHTKAFDAHPLYGAFGRLVVIFMAMQRFADGSLEMASNVDFYDEYSLRNLFASQGLGQYAKIPLKYQVRILKNINTLLRFKGTTRAIVDIVGIFGFESIQVFKHFLVKDFPRDVNGGIAADELDLLPDADDSQSSEDWDNMVLRFVTVPHDTVDIEAALRDQIGSQEDYDKFVEHDPLWQARKQDILKAEFNRVATKYVSIGSTMNLLKKTREMAYFRSMLRRAQIDTPLGNSLKFLNLRVSENPLMLYDVLLACQVLVFRILMYTPGEPTHPPDTIARNPSSVWTLYSYGFDDIGATDLPKNQGTPRIYLPDGTPVFIGGNEIAAAAGGWSDVADPVDFPAELTLDEFVTEYHNNDVYREAFKTVLRSTQSYAEYKRLRAIYDVRFFSQFQTSEFGSAVTFSEYLMSRSPDLAGYVDAADNETDRVAALLELTTSMQNYVSNGNTDIDPFAALDAYLIDYVKNYIMQLVAIFKSYTTEIRQFTITYIVGNDPFDNSIHWRERQEFIIPLQEANGLNALVDSDVPTGFWNTADGLATADDGKSLTAFVTVPDAMAAHDLVLSSAGVSAADGFTPSEVYAPHSFWKAADGLPSRDAFNINVIP
jgi:hypothetical protein